MSNKNEKGRKWKGGRAEELWTIKVHCEWGENMKKRKSKKITKEAKNYKWKSI